MWKNKRSIATMLPEQLRCGQRPAGSNVQILRGERRGEQKKQQRFPHRALKAKTKKCKKATGGAHAQHRITVQSVVVTGEAMFQLSKQPRVLAPMVFLSSARF
jgi:ribosomal protein L32